MRLHRQEKAAQRAAKSTGRPARITWDYEGTKVMVRARYKCVLGRYEMRYWVIGDDLAEVQVTRRELVLSMEVAEAHGQ
jgi:hypothetical protein